MTRSIEPTHAQGSVLAYIVAFIAENGFPPTRQEIADKMGYKSANAAEQHLRAMEAKGLVQLRRGVSRGIKVLTDE